MKQAKRVFCAIVCSIMLMGVCSCHDNLTAKEEAAATQIAEAILARDSVKLSKLIPVDEDKLRYVMSLDTPGTSGVDKEAREIIAATTEYSISCNAGNSGTAVITFSYADYKKAINDNVIAMRAPFDLEGFRTAVENCNDRVEFSLSFKFSNMMGRLKCTGYGPIETVYPYRNEDFDYIGQYFICNDDGVVTLNNTDITIDLPEPLVMKESNDIFLLKQHPEYDVSNLVCYARSDDGCQICTIFYDEYVTYDYISDPDIFKSRYAGSGIEGMGLSFLGLPHKITDEEFKVGGRTFVGTETVVTADNGSMYITRIAVGDEDHVYYVELTSTNEDLRYDFLDGISF